MNSALRGTVLVFIIITISVISGCIKEDPVAPVPNLTSQEYLDQAIATVDKDKLATDLMVIDDSLAIAGLTDKVLTEPKGVRYIINTLGVGGTNPTLDDRIQIKYTAKLLSTGEVFDASDDLKVYLFELIIGFQTTMPLLPSGTDVTLYIPSGYGYGPNGAKDKNTGQMIIPANSNLVFHVEFLNTL